MSSEPVDLVAKVGLPATMPYRVPSDGATPQLPLAASKAVRFAMSYGWRVGLFARISAASNGVYEANAPVFTFAPSDEQEVKPLSEVGEHWTCVGMVYPL